MGEVQFGLNVSTAAAEGADPVGVATRAEDLGFDFVSASDHLHGHGSTYEPWTLLSWIAAATSRIRVATRVLAVPTGTRRWWRRWPRPWTGCRAAG